MKKFILICSICLLAGVTEASAQIYGTDTLDINNYQAVFNSIGNNFSVGNESSLEIPKGTGQYPIGCNNLWISGVDLHGSIYLSAGSSASIGTDYFPGPLTCDGSASTNITTINQWNKVWKVSREEIENHKKFYSYSSYETPASIANWPAHGDTTQHQAYYLAPFVDVNQDGKYNPSFGDYPNVRGDQTLFFIYNDRGGIHTATNGAAWGNEIHAMAYAFNCPTDSAINNTIYLNYKIFNRRGMWLSSVYFGIYTDFKIGNMDADYIKSDIIRNTYYAYSADTLDAVNGGFYPAQAVSIVKGPAMDVDGIDNPAYDPCNPGINCNEGINGQYFGDNIVDNECLGMTGFISFNNGCNTSTNQPESFSDFSNYMSIKWKNGRKLQYGGVGYDYGTPYGPDCNFMYPGDSDPCNWGTNGYPTNGIINWREETDTNMSGHRHGLAVMGPCTIDAGAYQEIDIAFVYGVDYSTPNDLYSFEPIVNQYVASIKSYFYADMTPCGSSFSDITIPENTTRANHVKAYPNPAQNMITLAINDFTSPKTWKLIDMMGRTIMQHNITSESLIPIDINDLPQGVYSITVSNDKEQQSLKFIKQ